MGNELKKYWHTINILLKRELFDSGVDTMNVNEPMNRCSSYCTRLNVIQSDRVFIPVSCHNYQEYSNNHLSGLINLINFRVCHDSALKDFFEVYFENTIKYQFCIVQRLCTLEYNFFSL